MVLKGNPILIIRAPISLIVIVYPKPEVPALIGSLRYFCASCRVASSTAGSAPASGGVWGVRSFKGAVRFLGAWRVFLKGALGF